MNQTWENVEKGNFEPDFGLFDLNLGLKKTFGEVYPSTS